MLSDLILKWETDRDNISENVIYNSNIYLITAITIPFTLLGTAAIREDISFQDAFCSVFIVAMGVMFLCMLLEFRTKRKSATPIYSKTFYNICIAKAKEILNKAEGSE